MLYVHQKCEILYLLNCCLFYLFSDSVPPLLIPVSSLSNFKQNLSHPSELAPTASILPSVEDSDFIHQTLREIEGQSDKSEQQSSVPSESALPSDDLLSNLHQLQPLEPSSSSDFSWNVPDRLLKPFSLDSNQHTLLHPPSELTSTDQIVLDSLQKLEPSIAKENLENETSQPFSADFSNSERFPKHESNSNVNQKINNNSFSFENHLVVSQDTTPAEKCKPMYVQVPYSQQSQPINPELQMTSQYAGQMPYSLLPPGTNEPIASEPVAIANPSLTYGTMMQTNDHQSASTLPGRFQYANFKQSNRLMQSGTPPFSQSLNFSQYGVEEGRLLETLNSNAVTSDPHWSYNHQSTQNTSSGLTSLTDHSQQGIRVMTDFQNGNFTGRKISSNSTDSFHLQRHLSVGSLGSSQSPMMQPSPGSGSLSHGVVPPSKNLKSPMTGLPAGSPVPSHFQGMMGSPATPAQHISPTQGPGAHPPVSRQMISFSTSSEREFRVNESVSWSEPQATGPSATSNYHAHVAHTSVELTDSYAHKPCQSPIHVNPIPNHFLGQPGSSFHLPIASKPCIETVTQEECPSHSEETVSSAAVRLSKSQVKCKNETTGPSFTSRSTSAVQQKIFTNTMKSVLFGHPPTDEGSSEKLCHVTQRYGQCQSTVMATSPTEVHPTISPGESGYDSTDLGSVTSDTLSQHGGFSNAGLEQGRTFEAIPSEAPKNAQAALVGNTDRPVASSETQRATETSQLANGKWEYE